MLQLSAKIVQPRPNWWAVAAQNLLASSAVTGTNPQLDGTKISDDDKIEKVHRVQLNQRNLQRRPTQEKLFDTSGLKNLMNDSKDTSPLEDLSAKINSAQTVKDVLQVVDHKDFNKKIATSALYRLCHWVESGKVRMHEFQNDFRYEKLCQVMGISKESLPTLKQKDEFVSKNFLVHGLLQTEKAKHQMRQLGIIDTISVFSKLANQSKRNTPILQTLAFNIVSSKEKLNIKQLGDILYSMAVLNFYDATLIQKTCKDLIDLVPENKNTAVVGSILTSLGMLRYRDEKLLNELSLWVQNNHQKVRPQEISSLLLTLAHVGYTPENFESLFKEIVQPLSENDMCQSSDWLDIVWALTILNNSTAAHFESVLNSSFLNRLFDGPELKSAKAFKILNINAAARLLMPNYKGPLIPENSEILETPILKTKDKMELANMVTSALKIFLPSDSSYLNTNINTKMGFLLDAFFCVDKKCTPLPVTSDNRKDKKVYRIALLTCTYHEFCRGSNNIVGLVKLYRQLLEAEGYKVLLVPYNEVNFKDKLVIRVKYLNDNLKNLINQNI